MVLREILRALERIERKLGAPDAPGAEGKAAAGEWIQTAIDNILSYRVGGEEMGEKR